MKESSCAGALDLPESAGQSFDNHPLLIQALAGEVANDRRTPRDFDRWRQVHPDFDPFRLPLVHTKSHILAFALQGLDENANKVLHTIAASRIPATYDTFVDLLVGQGKPFRNETSLVSTLADLEDRGLLGWDRQANRYELHPLYISYPYWDLLKRIASSSLVVGISGFSPYPCP